MDSQNRARDEDEEAMSRQEEVKRLAEAKLALRHSNINPDRPDAAFFKSLDSSIKRNTAVIKKLKQINEEQREGLLEELRVVNLSKFVSEAVTAICDAKLKSSDINAAVQVCSLLHQRYKDFSSNLLQGLLKVFFPGKLADDSEGDRSLRAMKKRSSLRLLVELYYCGVIDDVGVFSTTIKDLTNTDHLRDRDTVQMHLSLLVSFARQGRVFLGLPLQDHDTYMELYKELGISLDQKKHFRRLFQSYYEGVVELLLSEHSALQQLESENARLINAKGELSEENASSYEKLRKAFEHLLRSVSSLAEALDLQPPVMPEDGRTTHVTSNEELSTQSGGKDSLSPEPIWDDEDTRSFYETLPDLRAFVPAVLLGEAESKSVEQTSSLSKSAEHQDANEQVLTPKAADGLQEIGNSLEASSTLADECTKERERDEKEREKNGKDKECSKTVEKDKVKEEDSDRKEKDSERRDKESEREKLKGIEGANLDTLLQRLPGCVSRDLIDQLTVDFCYLNSKSSRKKLVRALFSVPRTSLELLPYYSRMAATLSTCMKDVAAMLLQLLEEEFNFLINKKDQMNIETKIKNIRFIGELAKFKVSSATLVFSCLKCCLDDFTHHNIDVACNLLETCGRFFYRSPETTVRMSNMLEIMMRLKNVKNLDARHSTMVENAYYQCKPPDRSSRVMKVRSPLQQYIRKLLFSDLNKSCVEHVLRQLRKLPWDECESYILKCFLKVHKGKYSQVHLIASLTAGLSRYHDAFCVAVVDEVLEEIRLGLELNSFGMQQKRLAHMRFLGELYNYRIIDSCVIFDTLYLVIFFGYGTPELETLDPPEDCFRLRMVVTVLETCGHYFDRGSSKRKLDRFLLYFQRYVLSKGVIPLDIEFELQDLFAELRPKMIRYSTYEEANAAIADLEEQEQLLKSEKRSNKGAQGIQESMGKHRQMFSHINGTTNSQSGQGIISNGAQQGGGGGEDGESETETESGSFEQEDYDMDEYKYPEHEDDGEDDEEDDDGGVDLIMGSDEDDHVRMKQTKVAEVDPAEEADFEKELRAVMQESIDSRKLEIRTRSALNMTIPMNLFESSKDHGRSPDTESGDDITYEQGVGNSVTFRVLVKKGNKQQTKQLHIPKDSSLVQSTKQKEAAELEEKQDIKRLVLEYNDREEDESGGITAAPINRSSSNTIAGRGSGQHRNNWDSSGGTVNYRQRRSLTMNYGRRR